MRENELSNVQHLKSNIPIKNMIKKLFIFSVFILTSFSVFSQQNLIEKIMSDKPELFGDILKNPEKFEVQIIYTQINRDAKNKPSFNTFKYRVDKNHYFYPASTVKFPAVLLALEKMNKISKLNISTTMLTDSAFGRQEIVHTDTSSASGLPSIGHYSKKILLVSDNDAFNRLYEFIGQKAFNDQLKAKGYLDTRILHRLSYLMTIEQNRYTNPIRFVEANNLIYSQPQQYNPDDLVPKIPIAKGIGYMKGDKLVSEPFDFTSKNAFPLEDQHEILKAVLFPEAVPKQKRFNLTPDQYKFVYQYMSQLPSESTYPRYDSTFYDGFCKFTMFGDSKKPMPKHIRVFNKVGDAYGFLLDNAYVVDFKEGIEFMLTAVMYCNADQVFNDDKYDYDSVGFPFFGNLGRTIYDFEKNRKKVFKPNLKKFKLKYDR